MKNLQRAIEMLMVSSIALVVSACGGGGGTDATSNSINPSASTATTASGKIGTGGGTLGVTDRSVQLVIPAGALSSDADISLEVGQFESPLGTIQGKTVKFGPEGLRFSQPVSIRINYEPSMIPAGLDESELTLAYSENSGWTQIPTTIDVQNKTIIGQTTHFSTYSVTASTASKSPYGTLLGSFNGVSVYSNGCVDPSTPACGAHPDTYNINNVGGYNTGLQWQCVEFVNRYYYQTYGLQIRIPGENANLYFRNAARRGLIAHPNGGSIAPQVGDIIVSEGIPSNVGHVAIVRSVSADKIDLVQQNWHEGSGDLSHPLQMTVNNGTYTVASFGPSYPVTGWIRPPQASVPVPVAVAPTSWEQGRRRTGSGGSVLSRAGGDLISSGADSWMVSSDNGSTWQEKFAPVDPLVASQFASRLVLTGASFSYTSSTDGGRTWAQARRLPGLPSKYDNFTNGASCLVQTGGKLFARAERVRDPASDIPVWLSSDGEQFRTASSTEVAELDAALTSAGGRCNGSNSGVRNLMRDVSIENGTTFEFVADPGAIGSKYFRQRYALASGVTDVNAAFLAGVGRLYDYSLEISTDGSVWSPVSIGSLDPIDFIGEVAPNRFVALGYRQSDKRFRQIRVTYLSTDGGRSWLDVGGAPTYSRTLSESASIGAALIAVGQDGLITKSDDNGGSWRDIASPTSIDLFGVAAGAGVFVAVGELGTILTSSDRGTNWTIRNSGTTGALAAVAFGNGRFIVVSREGQVLTSTDGVAWAAAGAGLATLGQLSYSVDVIYGNGAFVINAPPNACVGTSCGTGAVGTFVSRDNGASWTRVVAPEFFSVAYGRGIFLAEGRGDSVTGYPMFSSADLGATWAQIGRSTVLGRVAFGDGAFAIGGGKPSPASGYVRGYDISLDAGRTWSFNEVFGGVNRLDYSGSRWVGVGAPNQLTISRP